MAKSFFKTGMAAIEVVVEIVKQNPTIDGLAFYAYAPKPNIFEAPDRHTISQLLLHDSPAGNEVWIKREAITSEKLYSVIGSLKKEKVLAVLSKVVLKHNKILHIPMMDFSEDLISAEQKLANIVCFLNEAGYNNGVVLFSGRSFHYYGNYLLTDTGWRNFLGDCLLSGLADSRYIGHREKDGYGVLRLSTSNLRCRVPKVVSILE